MIGRRQLLRLGAFSAVSTLLPRRLSAEQGGHAHGADSGGAHRDLFLFRAVEGPRNLSTAPLFLDRPITETEVFYVRSHFGAPRVDPKTKIRVRGLVDHPLDLGLSDLRGLPEVTLTAVLESPENGRAFFQPRTPGIQWTVGAIGQATWTGVRLRDVLARAGVKKEAQHLHLRGADVPSGPRVPPYIRSLPIARALHPSTLVAYRMNGAPLTRDHGAPFRLVVPGWGGQHWMKWLTDILASDHEAEGYFQREAYRIGEVPLGPLALKAIVARPEEGQFAKAGPAEVTGVAFAGETTVAKVEVSIDGGATWAVAKLEGAAAPGVWRVFRLPVVLEAGRHIVMARATDEKGNVQPQQSPWNDGGWGFHGWHAVRWEVVS